MKGSKVALISTLFFAVLFQCQAKKPKNISANINPSASVGNYADVDPSATLEEEVVVGAYSEVGPKTIIRKGATVGKYSEIGSNVELGPESNTGNYVEIEEFTKVSEYVTLANYAKLGPNNTVLPGTVIASYSESGNDVIFGRDNVVKNYACFEDGVVTGDGCVIDKYAELGAFTKLQKKAYVGQYSTLGSNVMVGADAVVHKYTKVADGEKIRDGEVILRTPSSLDFFMEAAPISSILDAYVNTPAQASDASFNALMRDKASSQLSQFKVQCRNPPCKGMLLPQLKALFLFRFYGKDRCIEIQNALKSASSFNNNFGRTNNMLIELSNEFHFGKDPSKTVISPEVQDLFVKLLALELDSARDVRVEGDTVCAMVEAIASKKRAVRCSDGNVECNNGGNYRNSYNVGNKFNGVYTDTYGNTNVLGNGIVTDRTNGGVNNRNSNNAGFGSNRDNHMIVSNAFNNMGTRNDNGNDEVTTDKYGNTNTNLVNTNYNNADSRNVVSYKDVGTNFNGRLTF